MSIVPDSSSPVTNPPRRPSSQSSYSELADVLAALPLLVREARRARRLSLRAAAAEIGCAFSTVTRFERGEDVTLSNATAMLRWLDTGRAA